MEKGRFRHPDIGMERGQRTGNGIMLVSGNYRPTAGRHQTFDGNVQSVGCIVGKNHLFRVIQPE